MAVTVYENDSSLSWINAAWDTGVTYNVHDALEHGGTSYRCIVSHSAKEPGVAGDWATYWAIMAEGGDDGSAGAAGDDGVTEYNYTFSKSGALTVATGNMRGPVPYAGTIIAVLVMVNTAPTGATLIVDVHKNGTTIFTTQGNRPTVAISAFSSGVVTNMNVTALAVGDYLTVDVDQIGSTIAGSDLSVVVVVEKT